MRRSRELLSPTRGVHFSRAALAFFGNQRKDTETAWSSGVLLVPLGEDFFEF